jgi:hypothetical protein
VGLRDVPINEWPQFLQDFSRGHRAWLATVDKLSPGAAHPDDVVVERPLRSITPEVRANRVVSIEIRFQEDSHAREAVRIDAPTGVRVDETSQGTARGIEVVDENGDRTRVHFRAAPRPEMLDGVAPGELSSK